MIISYKKRKDNFFDNLPTDEEIAKVLCAELLLMYKDVKLKNTNTLDYIIQQLPKNYTYRRCNIVVFECFNYLLNLIEQSKHGD